MLIRARRRPGVVGRIDRDAGLPLPGELPRYFRAECVHAVDQQRIHIGLDGIEIRRQEQTRSPRLHLMDIVHDLRMPDVVERVDRQLRFNLGEGVPVAVVVMTGVMVIQLRGRGPLGGRAECAVVPVRDDGHAVGVLRGHEPEDHVVEDRARGGAGVGGEPIRQRNGRKVTADFSRVNARRDEDDRLAVLHRLPCGAACPQRPWIGQLCVELPVVIETAEIRWTRDHQGEKGRTQRGLADLPVIHAVARLGERLVVALEHRPFDELPIIAGVEAQDRPRGGNDGANRPVGRGCSRRGPARRSARSLRRQRSHQRC